MISSINSIQELDCCPFCEDKSAGLDVRDHNNDCYAKIDCKSCGIFEIQEECLIFNDKIQKLKTSKQNHLDRIKSENEQGNHWVIVCKHA